GFVGFQNAFLVTGEDRYLDVWRKQIETVNAQKKVGEGRTLYPHMFGEQGWYSYTPVPYAAYALELYYLSHRPHDRPRVPPSPWLDYLEGKNPNYPEQALQRDLAAIRAKVAAMRRDTTTPDTRLSDDPLRFTPARVEALTELMLGGVPPRRQGSALLCRLRYF